jgi:hypothetical protein
MKPLDDFGFLLAQRTSEKVTYAVLTTKWGSEPDNAVVTLWDMIEADWVDVSATCLDGVAAVEGDTITLPKVQNLEVNHTYFLDVQFDSGENTLAFYLRITCLR